ncbi:MAG: phosphate acyltransferase PlsX [Clostridia bacterium]|uniref:phosphate acyltransferase PlsX n=1 Tax=Mogibacterium kristiansenii TaxID=2606708 RepID=UPI002409B48B|nr:phosphate acyltransferase PlsX [Mogibacterium kristiansenii]MDD6700658.1 phosphate acyltransferase PlsX [Mogibacterium kristiansenii]MDY5450437.1 phosphate acyltransferase PlsX [Clostridia bacterium]MEE0369299.1 phosphate acyltransferase PlsX [Clostridia bacterium]
MNIMIDGMGGDHAPEEIVKGAVQAAKEISGTVSIIGREERINECLQALNWNGDNIEIVNATEVISNNESPAMAVRKKKDSSISKGMRMLKEGEVDAFISGGSTGALLSAGLLILGRIRGIKRPAIAAFFPKIGMNDTSLILDCGANAESRPEYLLQYGIMGSIFVEKVKGIENPEVMLLNVGAEEEKGDPLHKESFELLRNADINFKGNCEGRDVPFGCCDVVVTDGFSGNVFLKSSEGVALAVMKRIKQKMTEGLAAKAGALLSYNKLKEIKKEFDYSEEGGAPILGLKGPVLKIHGSSKANAVYNAILKAVPYVEQDVTALIENAITEKSSGEE